MKELIIDYDVLFLKKITINHNCFFKETINHYRIGFLDPTSVDRDFYEELGVIPIDLNYLLNL